MQLLGGSVGQLIVGAYLLRIDALTVEPADDRPHVRSGRAGGIGGLGDRVVEVLPGRTLDERIGKST